MNILNKAVKGNLALFISGLVTILFILLVALNVSPAIRGPNDKIFESHWPYYFVNTLSKIWAPLLISSIYLLLYSFIKKGIDKASKRKEFLYLLLIVIVVFIFQISLVYFSRFGLTILFRRIADSGINGYFTAAINIQNIHDFFVNYPTLLVTSLPQHARGDPPGGTLLMYFIVQFFSMFASFCSSVISHLKTPVDSLTLWKSLSDVQRFSAIFLGFFLHFLSALTVIPFYYLIKEFINKNTALKTAVIWGVIPSLTFFSLIFDPFYTIFPLLTFLVLVLGYKRNDARYFFYAGFVFSVGLFLTVSILPILFFLLVLLVFSSGIKKLKVFLSFTLGIIVFPAALLTFGYNSLVSGYNLIIDQTPRSYLDWVIYNPYDFIVYIGIPVSILFIFAAIKIIKLKEYAKYKKILYAFLITFVVLVISGVSRGEVGRIWIPLMTIPVGIVGLYLSKQKENLTYATIALLILECIVLEEFWVPIW